MKIKHTSGCVTVTYDNETEPSIPWLVEVRSQLGRSAEEEGKTQYLRLCSNDLAALHLVGAIGKVREARQVLEGNK